MSIVNPTLPTRQPGDVYRCMIKDRPTKYNVVQNNGNYVCKNIVNQLG